MNEIKAYKNNILSDRAHASTVLSVLHVHLSLLVPYFATRSARFAQIRKSAGVLSLQLPVLPLVEKKFLGLH